ncbi:sigma-70 family RNA polymerase sigma factor [Aquimarina sp. MMG015]|uniref:RNA polymerase sigma factor n=1 Tax=unclassified Aquimarina TaxID=2627091 RepID=UPI000E4B8DB7|nr:MULTISPECIES: sigma-70 family RNA polymerase sigma factor [unclassified Aquimarina]AXT56363.1 sigma-70 family RNA polymerase sigma factor [Aquimarina sp. AD1]MBQ4803524.1 sigma-70 family RNA polymerase sigma factor [Aquimarina sp. MMG015]RKN02082.1 sigma-70 family RNA polymerase sigma factor [Aquimarina sp. AD1]
MPKTLFKDVCEERLFSELFKKHSKNLHDFIYYKYGSHINPKDQVQEAFIKLWDNCNKVSIEKAKSFLFTVANNLTLNQIKHDKVKLNYKLTETKNSTNESPQFIMEEKEYLLKYQNALSNLTESQRVAFLMNRIEGKKHKEIAELLGISRKAVEKRIYGALEKLRKDIEGI